MVCVARPPTCGRPEDVFKLKGCLSPAAAAFSSSLPAWPLLTHSFQTAACCTIGDTWTRIVVDTMLQLTAGGQLSS